MSGDSLVQRLRAGYSVWNETGDVSGLLAELDPDVEVVISMGGPEGTIAFRGHEGIAKWATDMGDVWRDLTFEPLEIESDEARGRALVIVRVSTVGRASDLGLEAREAHVLTLGPNGKVARMQGFNDLGEARAVFERG